MGENATAAVGVPNKLHPASYAPGAGRKGRRNPIQQAADLTIKAMLQQGVSIRKAAEALHVSASTVQAVKRRMLAQAPDAADLKSGLMSPHLGEMSVAVVEHFLKKGVKLKTVKGSDAMAAVKAVQDRQCPTQQAAPPGPRIQFVQINIDAVRLDDSPKPLDITPSCAPLVIDGT